MKPFAKKLGEYLRENRAHYVRAALSAVEHNPEQGPGAFSEADLGQMVDGFLAVILEELEERDRDSRDMYLGTVIPGLIASGTPVTAVTHTVTAWSVLLGEHAGRTLPKDPERDAMVTWLSSFLGRWMADIVAAAIAASRT